MTIVSTNTVEHYAGDGVQTDWPVTFPFLRPEDVRAVVSGTGGDRVLAYGTDYTAAALPGGGGSVTTIPGTPGAPGMVGAGEQLTLWLDQPFTQEMDLRNTGVLDAEMLERGFDRLTLMAQQLREEVGRCVKVPLTDQTTRTDALLAGITVNVGRAEVAALNAGSRAADADAGAGRAEAARDGAETARAQAETARNEAEAARGEVAQAVADARQDVLASAAFVPIGAILDFPVHTVPAGFLACAGQTVTREAYPDLVAYLTGDPLALSATLPDLRGEFRRGADLGRGVDAGRVPGSAQADQMQYHRHSIGPYYTVTGTDNTSSTPRWSALSTNRTQITVNTNYAGTQENGSENRPRNVAVVSCIKAYHAPSTAQPVDLSGVLARLNAIEASGAEAKQPQTILRCRMGAPLAAPFHDLALPDFLSSSGLTVTLLADPASPFGVCFGNGGTSVASELTDNLAVTLPGAEATYWLYVDRNPDTGALALGGTADVPEYANARRVGMGDWYSPAENIMRRADNTQVQRVYVGKAVVGGGTVTAAVPFHPGVEAVIPINNGGYLASAAQYTQHNPLGVPLADFPAVEIHDATAGRWITTGTTRTSSEDVGCYGQAHAGDVILFRTFANNRFWWNVAGSPLAYTTTYSRMRCRRAF